MELSDRQESLIKVVQGLTPATAQQVAAALGQLSLDLNDITEALTFADEIASDAAEEYGHAYDMAFLKAGNDPQHPEIRVTEKVREAAARVETYELKLKMEKAKLEVRRLKRIHECLDRRIFVGQSIAKTIRSEMQSLGGGQWGA